MSNKKTEIMLQPIIMILFFIHYQTD